MFNFFNKLNFRKNKVSRVITRFTQGYGTGSGFFIGKNKFLTCFHVIFGAELNKLKNDPVFVQTRGSNEHQKLENYIKNKVSNIEVVLPNNSTLKATLNKFDENYDIALLDVETGDNKVEICEIDFRSGFQHGDYVYFGGFPTHHDYLPENSPFAVHEGVISAFVNTTIGGGKYEHLQINSINLGGNSGAPLFKKNGSKVVGIINGNMNWGNDNVLIFNPQNKQAAPTSFRIPLSIAYATPVKLINENTEIFKDYTA